MLVRQLIFFLGIQGEFISQVEEQKNEEILLEKISNAGFDAEIKQQLLKKKLS